MKWENVRLGDLCNMNSGGTPRRGTVGYYGGEIPWAKISDIEDAIGGVIFTTEEYITKDGLKSIGNRVFPEGTLLLAMYGSVGKTAIAGVDLSTNQAILGIRIIDSTRLSIKYLKYWLGSIKEQLLNRAVGGTLQNISLGIVKELFIPLPPIHIQEQIADTLDKADALRRKDQELLQKYDQLAQAIFYDMFGDPVINEKGWNKYPLKQLGKVTTGNTPPRDNAENYGSFIEWIKSDNISHEYDYPQPSKEFLSEIGKSLSRTIHSGSILVTCIAGSPVTIGNCVLTDRSVTLNQQINAFTPTKGQDELFVFRLFRESKKLIQSSTTSGMKRIITKGEFEKLEFIDPPVNLQKEFGEKYKILSKSRSIHLDALKKSELVFNSQSNLFFQL
jgi:type I restriction enzyme S subunit